MTRPTRLRSAAALGLALALGAAAFTGTASAAAHKPGKGPKPKPSPTSSPTPTPTSAPPAANAFAPGLPLLTDKGANTGGAEPSLAVDKHGNVYVAGPVGVPTGGCPVWTIHPGSLNAKGLPYEYDGTSDTDRASVGGGDCDISTGPNADAANSARYDDISVSSLSLANLATNNATDGHTFSTPANPVGTQVFGVDRQWQASDYKLGGTSGVHYLTVHDLATTNIDVAVSTDGGYAYTTNSTAIDAAHQGTATGNNGNHFGTVVVNPTTHQLYIPFIAPASATDSVNDVVYVAEGTPNPTNPALPITWVDHTVYTGPVDQTLDHIFPAITVDGAGRVYVAWAGDTKSAATNRIALSRMTTPGDAAAWTAPTFVDTGSAHSNLFPWLAAGKDGVVDVAWYGGNIVGSGSSCPTSQSGQPNDSAGVNNNCFDQWTTRFAQSTDAGKTFSAVDATGLVHKGSICDQGTACLSNGGDRTLLDFFDMEVDPAGGANIAYASDLDTPGTAQITYTRQCAGTSANGGALTRSCDALVPPATPGPTTALSGAHLVTDPAGDNTNPTGAAPGGSTDVTDVGFASTAATIDITLMAANLQQVPPAGTTTQSWYVTWVGPDGKRYGVQHSEPSATSRFTLGQYDATSNRLVSGTTSPVPGSFNAGPNGTVVWHVPRSAVGSPTIPVAAGSTTKPAVTGPYAVTIVGEGSADVGGLVFVQPSDRAPNSGGGPAWSVS